MESLEGQLASDQAIWVVAAVLYVWSHVRTLEPDQLLLEERAHGRLTVRLTATPFTLWGRAVTLLHPLPWVASLILRWGETAPKRSGRRRRGLRQLACLRGRLRPVRVAATTNALALFVAGPVITELAGLVAALLTVLLVTYTSTLFVALHLARAGRAFLLDRWALAALLFEAVVCPPYSATLVKLVTTRITLDADGLVLTRELIAPDEMACVQRAATACLEARLTADESPAADRLRRYLATLESKGLDGRPGHEHRPARRPHEYGGRRQDGS